MDWGSILNNTLAGFLTPTTIAFALAALGLAMHFGFAGLLNFGIAGFMAIGGYGYAISVLTFGLPWWAGMLVGVLGSVVFALILGIPTLRLRGDYLAIATIASRRLLGNRDHRGRRDCQAALLDHCLHGRDGLCRRPLWLQLQA